MKRVRLPHSEMTGKESTLNAVTREDRGSPVFQITNAQRNAIQGLPATNSVSSVGERVGRLGMQRAEANISAEPVSYWPDWGLSC